MRQYLKSPIQNLQQKNRCACCRPTVLFLVILVGSGLRVILGTISLTSFATDDEWLDNTPTGRSPLASVSHRKLPALP